MLTIPLVLKDTEEKMRKAAEVASREFSSIRSGRATPALLEGVKVECYGTLTPLKQLASLSTPDPKLVVVQPWDLNLLSAVEKAILAAGLGVTPISDKKVLRVPIPPLSAERREEFVKLAHKQAESGRVSIRTIRHAAKDAIEQLFKEKAVTEDEKFKALDGLEKLTRRLLGEIDTLLKAKEAEIRQV